MLEALYTHSDRDDFWTAVRDRLDPYREAEGYDEVCNEVLQEVTEFADSQTLEELQDVFTEHLD